MASRDTDDLTRSVNIKCMNFLTLCEEEGMEVLVYCTVRSVEEQAILYRQSRPLSRIKRKAKELSDTYGRSDLARVLMDVGPQTGRHVTNAGPGQSLHNYGLAFDGCPIIGGKPLWADTMGGGAAEQEHDEHLWQRYGEIAQYAGLEWAGNWTGFREYPHCQEKGTRWQDLIGTDG